MKRWGWAFLYLALFLLAAGAALLERRPPSSQEDTRASVDSFGEHGLSALREYLVARGRGVDRVLEGFDALPLDTAVLVWVAPFARPVLANELDWAEQFVREGGTLVVLFPNPLEAAPRGLMEWVGGERGALPPNEDRIFFAGATVWRRTGALGNVKGLGLRWNEGLSLRHPDLVPLAGRGEWIPVWGAALDEGELYVFSSPDVASNRALLEADNLVFWEALSRRGRVVFWEHHQWSAPPIPLPTSLAAAGVQGLLLVLFVLWAFGTRLGPPRPLPKEAHRERIEYVDSFARVLRGAKVEPELAGALRRQLRLLLWERHRIPLTADDSEAALRYEQVSGAVASEMAALLAELETARATQGLAPSRYAALAQRTARIETALLGGRPRA